MTPINNLSRYSIHSNRFLHLSKPTNLFVNVALTVRAIAFALFPLIAAIFIYLVLTDPTGDHVIKKPDEISFNNLKLSLDDQESIKFIVENLATKGKFELLKLSYQLSSHGKNINNVHPLKFISFIMSDKKMKKEYLPEIMKDSFKKNNFMKGLTNSLKEMNDNDLLKPCLIDFMNSVNIHPTKKNQLLTKIEEEQWDEFFNYVVNNSKETSSFF